jgi:hypothetical protein
MSLKRRNSNWEFSIHVNPDKGPNRVCFDPTEAQRFFRKTLKSNRLKTEPLDKVKHLATGLVWETEDYEELNEFICVLVDRVGVRQHG